ncbi:MAG: hypothetical protein GX107_03970 [Clostridiales bacterium]|nr:hypothetical protein [Clostridiales bacterium]
MQNKRDTAINPFALFAVFIGSVIIALPIRVYQLLTIIEPGTGFWETKNASVYILYAVAALSIICCAAISFFCADRLGRTSAPGGKKPVVGLIAFVVVAALIVNAVGRYADFSNIYFGYTGMSGMSVREYLTKTGAFSMALEAFFAVISSVYFILYGITAINGKSAAEYKLLAVSPVMWCIFRIIHRFMREISFLNVSELFFELCMIVFLMLFFMAFAQLTSKVNFKGIEWKLYAYGFPAAMFCLICFVPRLVVTILGKPSLLTDNSPIEYCDIAMAAFIIGSLISRARISEARKAPDREAQVDESLIGTD